MSKFLIKCNLKGFSPELPSINIMSGKGVEHFTYNNITFWSKSWWWAHAQFAFTFNNYTWRNPCREGYFPHCCCQMVFFLALCYQYCYSSLSSWFWGSWSLWCGLMWFLCNCPQALRGTPQAVGKAQSLYHSTTDLYASVFTPPDTVCTKMCPITRLSPECEDIMVLPLVHLKAHSGEEVLLSSRERSERVERDQKYF